MQEVHQFSDGSAVVLTVAEILPYKSDSYNGVGLKPDHEVSMTAEQTAQIGIMKDTDDAQLQKALELLAD